MIRTAIGKKLVALGARLLGRGYIVLANDTFVIPPSERNWAINIEGGGGGGGGPHCSKKVRVVRVPSPPGGISWVSRLYLKQQVLQAKRETLKKAISIVKAYHGLQTKTGSRVTLRFIAEDLEKLLEQLK